jgi:hypothetical protein
MRELNGRWLRDFDRDSVRRYLNRLRLEWRYNRSFIGSLTEPADHLRMIRFLRTVTYGGLAFHDERRLSDVYDTHQRNVLEYFRTRPQDLLVLDICGGEGWVPLCRFLSKSVPITPFPQQGGR